MEQRLGTSPRLNTRAADMGIENARYAVALAEWESDYQDELERLMAVVSEAWAHDPEHLAFIRETWAEMGGDETAPRPARYAGITYLRWTLKQRGARRPATV